MVRLVDPNPDTEAGWRYLDLGPSNRGWIPLSVLNSSRRPAGAVDVTDRGYRFPLRAEPSDDARVTGFYQFGY